eukprot:CAMPEP_0115035734 /NCGR_PEP_ID=MMETSP0216-20121206/41664_1 /TAXON_ID=223996 /ORGANISM="Protocruzia adherens, Strain Boccale" /LENGTH=115 /DNA_ID=CAMNT_0002415349 /DNA_START=173 /DNA_END=516 /DNA_ORIENTATION=-
MAVWDRTRSRRIRPKSFVDFDLKAYVASGKKTNPFGDFPPVKFSPKEETVSWRSLAKKFLHSELSGDLVTKSFDMALRQPSTKDSPRKSNASPIRSRAGSRRENLCRSFADARQL